MKHAHNTDYKVQTKNLVIGYGGTGNEILENITNAMKLYRCMRET